MAQATMNALRLHALGDAAQLHHEQIATPRPAAGEVLVRVHAAAITRDELEWPEDRLPAIVSYEFAGTIAEIGPGVVGVSVDEAVYALSGFDRDGAAGEYIALPAAFVAPKPRTLDYVEAAALPLAGLSAWQGLFDHGGLEAGQRVLIHGAGGGVGSLAVQLARQRGAYVIATTSSATVEGARELGADEVIDHTNTSFEEQLETTDLVFDTVGGERLERSAVGLRPGARLVSIAQALPEGTAERGVRGHYFVVEPNREQLVELARLADDGKLRVTIDSVFALADGRAAFERLQGGEHRGKIVLRVLAGD